MSVRKAHAEESFSHFNERFHVQKRPACDLSVTQRHAQSCHGDLPHGGPEILLHPNRNRISVRKAGGPYKGAQVKVIAYGYTTDTWSVVWAVHPPCKLKVAAERPPGRLEPSWNTAFGHGTAMLKGRVCRVCRQAFN